MTALSVCVDGITQDIYSRTRQGGNIERVPNTLERLLRFRKEMGKYTPYVEAQYIKFAHNAHQLDEAKRMLRAWGIDHSWTFGGHFRIMLIIGRSVGR